MRSKIVRKMLILSMVCLMVGALLLSSVAPALAWGRVTKHAYHFWMHQFNPGGANDAQVWGSVRDFPFATPWHAPALQAAWSSRFWFAGTGVVQPWRWVNFWGPMLPWSTWVWFNVDFREVNWRPLHVSWAWFRWTRNGVQVGPWIPLGWRVGSQVALFNPATTPDGQPNTQALVVTGLQFAMSPQRIPNDQTILGNPAVDDLLWTQARDEAGNTLPRIMVPPSTATADSFFDVFLDVSIPEPKPGGSTVLARGVIEVEIVQMGLVSTESIPFVVQFIAEENTPERLQALEQSLVNDAVEARLIEPGVHPTIPLPGGVTLPDGTITPVGSCDGAGCHPDSPPWDWNQCNTCHGPESSIHDGLDTTKSHQEATITQRMKVDVHHTIKLVKIEGDGIYFGSLNPLSRRVGTDVFWILVSSNDEYRKQITWTDFTGFDPDNPPLADGTRPTFTIPKNRLTVTVTKTGHPTITSSTGTLDAPDLTANPYGVTPSQFEKVDLSLWINWRDHAGSYTGTITVKAYQV